MSHMTCSFLISAGGNVFKFTSALELSIKIPTQCWLTHTYYANDFKWIIFEPFPKSDAKKLANHMWEVLLSLHLALNLFHVIMSCETSFPFRAEARENSTGWVWCRRMASKVTKEGKRKNALKARSIQIEARETLFTDGNKTAYACFAIYV